MIRDALNYLKEDKVFTLAFLFVAGILIFNAISSGQHKQEAHPYGVNPEIVEQFKSAETRFQEKVEQAGSIEAYLAEKPGLAFGFNLFLMVSLLVFAGGLIINVLWVFNDNLRKKVVLPFPDSRVDWKFSMIFRVIVYFLLGSIAFSLIFQLLEKLPQMAQAGNFILITHTMIVDILCLMLMFWVVKGAGGDARDLGLRQPAEGAWKEVKFAWSAYVAILPAFITTLIVLVVLTQLFSYEPPAHPLVNVFLEEEQRAAWIVGFSIFLATVVGPIIEEVFFRGFCYPVLKQKWGAKLAMILSALFFALIHQNSFSFIPIFILGLALVYVYEIRGSLVAPMIIHVTHNLSFITYFFLAKKIVLQEAG